MLLFSHYVLLRTEANPHFSYYRATITVHTNNTQASFALKYYGRLRSGLYHRTLNFNAVYPCLSVCTTNRHLQAMLAQPRLTLGLP